MSFEPETLTLDALRALPVPQFIERDPFEIRKFMVAKFEELTNRTLYPAQTEMFVIETMAYAKAVSRKLRQVFRRKVQ